METVGEGTLALERILEHDYDLVLLDVMLPGLDGYEICSRAREAGRRVPVLFLTAKGELDDRLRGLEVGADDYLPKPFHLRELLLRVEAILRRKSWFNGDSPRGDTLRFGENTVHFHARRATSWDGEEHELPEREAMLLRLLHENEGETVTRETILERLWSHEVLPSTRVVLALVEQLRLRFEMDPEAPRHLHTVRGLGYRFTREPEESR